MECFISALRLFIWTPITGDLVPLLKGKPNLTPLQVYTFPRREIEVKRFVDWQQKTEDFCVCEFQGVLIKGGDQTWIFALTIY